MKNIFILTFLFCLSAAPMLAQDKLNLELKGDSKPDVYIDGKKYDYSIFELLDQSKIESVNVLKDKLALKKYNAPNGVIIVKTKKTEERIVEVSKKEIKIGNAGKEPVIIINGKVASKEILSKMSPDDIAKIEVVKGEAAIKKYNAPNGAIIIKTKK